MSSLPLQTAKVKIVNPVKEVKEARCERDVWDLSAYKQQNRSEGYKVDRWRWPDWKKMSSMGVGYWSPQVKP